MKKVFFLILVLSVTIGFSQSNYKNFKKLSSPKKWWVVFHPFKAKKALEISKEASRVSDSIRKTDLLDRDHAGGQVDAFRHAYWMARLRQEIGKSAARSLGKAHEKENYLMYKKRKLEEGVVPDEISSEMDLFNNDVGLTLTVKNCKTSKIGLIHKVANAIKKGKMKVIKKNKKGEFLMCDGKLIESNSLKGKWKNNKCLVDSNYKRN
ncbi:DUF6973 domain-containing protein [Tenacibaculum jejuense]|uniref:DUF6973 domain-containing protein n=1 Tax=Tenacibaculum jejuense TaxID=584609 RepID=A0A238UGJ7_9FLAO|nr:hypothetical protein [Tenacibaculum jejuense]SNR17658.1 conserved protein of unknown function [Tenacibaculum jejuense]